MPRNFRFNQIDSRTPHAKGKSFSQRADRRDELLTGSTAGESIVKGKIKINGGGDAEADINFPVWFIESPHMTFGGEVSGSVDLTLGSFPIISAIVGRWTIKELDSTETRTFGRKFYTGCQLLISVDGTTDVIIHYQFTGTSITNPTGDLTTFTTDSAI
jgi:hypothetical protein